MSSRAQWRVFGVGGGCIIVELVVRVMFVDEKKVVVKKLKKVLTHTMILTLRSCKRRDCVWGAGFCFLSFELRLSQIFGNGWSG